MVRSAHAPTISIDAIVMIVAGDLATGPATQTAVEALRMNGDWVGPIAILTDRKACLERLNAEPLNLDVILIPVELPPRETDPDAWLMQVTAAYSKKQICR